MGPTQSQWPNYEEKPQVQAESNHSINSTMQVSNNFFQYKKKKKKHQKTKETSCFPFPDCWRHFCKTVNSVVSELLMTNYTMGGGTTVLLPRLAWVQKLYSFFFFFFPSLPPLLHHCRICGITSCRSVVWGVLITG